MKINKYRLSVIIPTYNRKDLLEYTLLSMVQQSLSKDYFEVIITDDGSSDSTFSLIEKFEDRLNLKYVYQMDRGYCPASARNMGIKLAEGEICLFFDSGMVLKTNCLLEHANFHARRGPDIALIGYIYGFCQGELKENALMEMADLENVDETIKILQQSQRYLDVRDNIFTKYNDQIENLDLAWTLFWGGHLSISKENLMEVGLFDENYDGRWGCEDNDLGLRLKFAEKTFCFCRQTQALHLPHRGDAELKRKQGYENCVYFHNKFQLPETKLYLEHYLNEITSAQATDFSELAKETGNYLVIDHN
jgi:glycosyltransferase involved in cell wall biosynthesis